MATRKTSARSTGTRTRAATAARKTTEARKTATARKSATPAKAAGRKTATGSARKAARKTATARARKTTARGAATKTATAKQAATKKTTAKKASVGKTATKKAAAGKKPSTARTASARRPKVTPEQALANTRQLLEAKQAKRHETPPWQALGEAGGHASTPHPGFQSDDARIAAHALHNDEVDLPAVQGHISDVNRQKQGRRDNRTQNRH